MGATNEIKRTNITLKLSDLTCSQCSQKFTEQEIKDRNFDLWFDTTNDVKLIPMAELKDICCNYHYYRTGYELTIWIRSIEHRYCSAQLFELCWGCDERFLKEKMKEFKDNYYCEPCYKELTEK